MAETGEGGFFNKLKKAFFGKKEGPPPPPPPEAVAEGAPIVRKKREEVPARPAEIVEALKRVTPSHPARQLLPRLDFSEKVLQEHPQLGSLLLEIIYVPDSSVYHDSQWLVSKLRQLKNLEPALTTLQDDLDKLQKVSQAFEKKIRLVMTGEAGEEIVEEERRERRDERLVDIERKIREAKGESIPAGAQVSPQLPAKNWREAIDRFKDQLPESERNIIQQAIEKIEREGPTSPQSRIESDNIRVLGDILAESMKETINRVKAGGDIQDLSNIYIQQREAYEKLGRFFIESFPEQSELIKYVQRAGGTELFEKSLHENANYRDYVFYHLIENILYNQRAESSRELFNLWKAGDMDVFIEMVRKMKDTQGNPVGIKVAQRYTILKNTIFQSHDMDLYAAHPSQDMKEFIGSTSFFLNQYVDFAHQDPMVALAKRLYETVLLTIRESNDGYIPREYLNWNPGKGGIFLDAMVERMLKQAVAAGQLYGIKIDPVTGGPDLSAWDRIQLDPDKKVSLDELYGVEPEVSESWRRQLGDLKIAAALKQAKGLALVDMRLLEIIGRSKGTGADHFYFGGPGFNSVPYEGIVRHIEPIIHYFTRFYVGAEKYSTFFNMLVTDKPNWNPQDMKRLIQLHLAGDHQTLLKEFGKEVDTRLTAMDNPFSFSGMWGTFTKWRTGNATTDWDDWEWERLSTANKLTVIGDSLIREHGAWQVQGLTDEIKTDKYYREEDNRWTGGDGLTAKQYYSNLREAYRKALRASGVWELVSSAEDEVAFERKWRKVGLKQKDSSGKTYEDLLKKHLEGVKKRHHDVENEMKERQKKLERAYKARIWIQAAMRSPLLVARELRTNYKIAGYEKKGPLRKKIIYEILGIDLDEAAALRTPLKIEREQLERVMDLEGAVAAISQVAIRENRDLLEKDFDNIDDFQLRDYAKKYWHMVKDAMLGSGEDRPTADQWYQKIGIQDAGGADFTRQYGIDIDDPEARGLRFHKIDWRQIDKIRIDNIGQDVDPDDEFVGRIWKPGDLDLYVSDLLSANTVDRDWRYLFSTENMGWEYLNMGALGERNQVRRAGDLASHVQFNQLFEQYLGEVMKGRPKMEDLVDQLKKMWVAMSGDFGDVAVDSCGRVAYTTGQMYRKADWAWRIPGIGQAVSLFKNTSIMQILKGRLHADSWGPNEMRRWVEANIQEDIIPEHSHDPFTHKRYFYSEWSGELMHKRLGSTLNNVFYEIVTLGALIAIAVTAFRGLTKKSEEEEAEGD